MSRAAGPLEPIVLEGDFVRLEPMTLVWNGRYRDSIYYSILDEEWPEVKRQLERMLIRRPEAASSPH